jgi:hypothetical protein
MKWGTALTSAVPLILRYIISEVVITQKPPPVSSPSMGEDTGGDGGDFLSNLMENAIDGATRVYGLVYWVTLLG